MCERYKFSSRNESEMIRHIWENIEARNIEVKAGVVNPGDVAVVITSNRKLEHQVFGTKWGYGRSNGNLYLIPGVAPKYN